MRLEESQTAAPEAGPQFLLTPQEPLHGAGTREVTDPERGGPCTLLPLFNAPFSWAQLQFWGFVGCIPHPPPVLTPDRSPHLSPSTPNPPRHPYPITTEIHQSLSSNASPGDAPGNCAHRDRGLHPCTPLIPPRSSQPVLWAAQLLPSSLPITATLAERFSECCRCDKQNY